MTEIQHYSNNFLNDLMTSLENAPDEFTSAVCKGLRWSKTRFKSNTEEEIDIISPREGEHVLRVYQHSIVFQLLLKRSLNWKKRFNTSQRPIQNTLKPSETCSSTIIKDLAIALENAPALFKECVCSNLKWQPNKFDSYRQAPIANDHDTYTVFNKKQVSIIIPIYESLVMCHIHDRAFKWDKHKLTQ
ncbi:hypothetical protein CLV42_108257 [Chitinophaga ginsengisoli]|uniref:Uncharacterized protein n=1 Tax=Chitinophaga ginsengisoli TaxID=363837 RepID=A0A2P8G307_9BACT|nr:hypothetical protein CLV42_108257 [Chitinophaga ginsengisoli]